MKKLLQRIDFNNELYNCGFTPRHYNDMLLNEFDSLEEAANYLGCSVCSIYRFRRTRKWPIAMAKLLLIRRRGYLPITEPWSGFRIRGDILVTPYGREFTAMDLNVPLVVTAKDNATLLMNNKRRYLKF